MTSEELNKEIISLLESYENMQEFADLATPEENWSKIDMNIQVPSHVGFTACECPSCFEYIRLIYDKFSTVNHELPLTCPLCKASLKCKVEFTGYTSDLYLEEMPE